MSKKKLLKDIKNFQEFVVKLQLKNEMTLKAMFFISSFLETFDKDIRKLEIK